LLKTLLSPSLLSPSSYAFGLEETRYYREAEKAAREAIELQRKTPFAFHVMGEL
jgi:hypothetical protein